MRVQAISPRQLSHYIAPIIRTRGKKTSAVSKNTSKKKSHSALLEESIDNLSTQFEGIEDDPLFNEFHYRYEFSPEDLILYKHYREPRPLDFHQSAPKTSAVFKFNTNGIFVSLKNSLIKL